MKKNQTLFIAQSGVIAAVYVALTWVSALVNLSYGSIQLRLSEILTILPVFTPAAIPGLTIGCFIANFGSPYGIMDVLLGTLATLIASVLTYLLKDIKLFELPIPSALMPVLSNGLIVGAELAFFMPEGTRFIGFLISFLQVGFGELIACMVFGLILYKVLIQNRFSQILKIEKF